jgi:hypothetical protein
MQTWTLSVNIQVRVFIKLLRVKNSARLRFGALSHDNQFPTSHSSRTRWTLIMDTEHPLETSVSVYRRKHHIQEEWNPKLHCCGNLNTRFVRAVIIKFDKSECTRAVRKVSVHFEYLETRSRGLDVTWQPVRGDLTAHPWTVALPWG